MLNTLLEKDLIPEILIRSKIRSLLKERLQQESKRKSELGNAYYSTIRNELSNGPIAVQTEKANEQHYEVPAAFYQLVLGPHLKYSSGFWEGENFEQSEKRMLEMTCQRADLADGHSILELGCGWGSLTLFMAERFPSSYITAVSNSSSQADFIRSKAAKRKLSNITVITQDINSVSLSDSFDRIVSVEMFEHMRNYKELLEKVNSFMKENGKLFVHIFTHKEFCYKFDVVDDSDWMAKYFFSGGIMPSTNLLSLFDEQLKVVEHWDVPGIHYSKTAEAWLRKMKENETLVKQLFQVIYQDQSLKWFVYWKIFFMACSELWKFRNGTEWMVSHYLLEKKR